MSFLRRLASFVRGKDKHPRVGQGVFGKAGIRVKIGLVFLVLFLFTLSLGGNGLYQMSELNRETEELYQNSLQVINELGEVRSLVIELRLIVAKQLVHGDMAQLALARQDADDKMKRVEQFLEQYHQRTTTPYEQEKLQQMDRVFSTYAGFIQTVFNRIESGNDAADMFVSLERDGSSLLAAIRDLVAFHAERAAQQQNAAQERYDSSLLLTIILSALGLGACAVGLGVIRFTLVTPLQVLERAVTAMARGDLRMRVSIRAMDEIGRLSQAFNQLAQQWSVIVGELQESSRLLRVTAEELAESSNGAAETTGQVAAATERTAENASNQAEFAQLVMACVRQGMADLNEVCAEAEKTNQLAQATSLVANSGQEAVQSAVHQTEVLTRTVQSARQSIAQLAANSNAISRMTTMIGEIAAQTNLLALNAAIEAARVGVHGKGFAVVATEVQKLAEQSRAAASDIEQIVCGMQQETASFLKLMEETAVQVEAQSQQIGRGGLALQEIVQQAEGTSAQVAAMQDRLDRLVRSFQEVEQRMEQMSERIRETAAIAEEVTAASEEITAAVQDMAHSASALSGQAESLKEKALQFQA
ncbi:MAG: methyl-accepting chemotaxis protein [Brevibacillus sp.]|nr:methyl-accepting chemotaxis protein [Brevibacillus sp.]